MRRYANLLLISGFVLALVVINAQEDTTPNDESALETLNSRGVTVLPLEEVTESAPQVLDITSNSARLNFIGTIPLACTIVYGTTTDFGSASIDLNMNGGAIIEHNPVMINLDPDTEYFYRVQGSAEDGTFYVSEIGSFKTLEVSDAPVANLLSPQNGAQVIGVSSNFGDQGNDGVWGAFNAFDGNPNTAWSSNGDGDSAWIEVQLGQRSLITGVEFWTRFMTNGTARITEFTVTTDSGATYGPFTLPDAEQSYTFDVDFEAETLRFDVVRSTGGNTGAVDIAVYGESID